MPTDNRKLFTAIGILAGVLVILMAISLLVGGFQAGKNTDTSTITPIPRTQPDESSNKETQFRQAIQRSSSNQEGLSQLRSKVPVSTSDFDLSYSQELNSFVATLKTPQGNDKLKEFLRDNGAIDQYQNGSEAFIVTTRQQSEAVEDVKNALVEDLDHEQESVRPNDDQSTNQDQPSVETQKDVQLLSDLLKTLLTFDLGTTTGGTPDGSGGSPPPSAGSLNYPPNLGNADSLGYYQMPIALNGEYIFNGGTCAAQRYGKRELTGVIYTVALNWKDKYPDSRLMVGDLNASGHASHANGIDVDIFTSNRSGADVRGSKERNIELGKMFVNTKLIDMIFFNDSQVNAAVTAYARQNNLPLTVMKSWPGHDDHFHVRIAAPKGPQYTPGCGGRQAI